jgi:hypothetical protein
MGAYEDLTERLRQTDAVQQVLASLDKEPIAIFNAICSKYEATGQPVPSHHFITTGHIREVALRSLLEAGLLEQQPGKRLSIYSYSPTPEGMKYYKKLARVKQSRKQ